MSSFLTHSAYEPHADRYRHRTGHEPELPATPSQLIRTLETSNIVMATTALLLLLANLAGMWYDTGFPNQEAVFAGHTVRRGLQLATLGVPSTKYQECGAAADFGKGRAG